jgi:hypothetical protein
MQQVAAASDNIRGPEELLFPACQSSRDCVDNVDADLFNPLAPHFIDCREPD